MTKKKFSHKQILCFTVKFIFFEYVVYACTRFEDLCPRVCQVRKTQVHNLSRPEIED